MPGNLFAGKTVVFAALLAFLFLAGCTAAGQPKDCGQDMNCFAQYFSRCEPAKVSQPGEFVSYYEIKGWDENHDCEVQTGTS